MDAFWKNGFSPECPDLMAWPAHTGPHSPGHPLTRATAVGLVIYNMTNWQILLFKHMKQTQREGHFSLSSEGTFAALFTYFSLFHHRGAISRNYYVKQYIKKWGLVFFGINNCPHLFREHKCAPELTLLSAFRGTDLLETIQTYFQQILGLSDLPSTCPAPVPRQGTADAKVSEVTRCRKSFGTREMAAVRTGANHITALGLSFPPK